MAKKKQKPLKDGIHYNGVRTVSGITVVYMSEIKDGHFWRMEEIGRHSTTGPKSKLLRVSE